MGVQQLSNRQILPLGRINHTVAHKTAQDGFIGMLQLASAAKPEMVASRIDVVRACMHFAIGANMIPGHGELYMLPPCGHAVAACGKPDNFVHLAAHRHVSHAAEAACARSSAVKPAPAWRAASPCNQTASHAAV